jgi:peptide/nickel transport system ATP-binding protein
MKESKNVLSVENLKTYFYTKAGTAKAVNGISFSVEAGKIIGIVGESGSGKSVTGLSIMGLIDDPGKIVDGKILFNDKNLADFSEEEMRQVRGSKISMVFQDAMMTLNPVLRIDTQMVEAIRVHQKISKAEALKLSENALRQVGIPSPEKRLKEYPHQFSGGMRQRVVIAIAMLNEPDLIIADEPTTALDVTIQAQILYETQKLCSERGTALIWITHDLSVLAGFADYVCVMYAGKIVEQGSVDEIIDRPVHPYTIGLIGSVPRRNTRGKKLYQIPGMAPSLLSAFEGCVFYDRCEYADEMCKQTPVETEIFEDHLTRCFHPRLERYSK